MKDPNASLHKKEAQQPFEGQKILFSCTRAGKNVSKNKVESTRWSRFFLTFSGPVVALKEELYLDIPKAPRRREKS